MVPNLNGWVPPAAGSGCTKRPLALGEVRTLTGLMLPMTATELGVPGCPGFVGDEPQATLSVTTAGSYAVMAMGEGDLVLAVVGAGGAYCNDDWGSFNPGIFRELETGTYEIYVGSWERDPVIYELQVGRE